LTASLPEGSVSRWSRTAALGSVDLGKAG